MKRTKSITALTLAAVLLVLLTSAAYAVVQGGVLDYLFRNEEPSIQQKEMVQDIGVSHASDGVTTTVTDAVFDGLELSVGLLFQAQRNMYAVIDYITINGATAYRTCDDFSGMWLARDPFASGGGDYTKGLTATIDPNYFIESEQAGMQQVYQEIQESGHADISVGLSLLTPNQALAMIDIYVSNTAAMWEAIDAACASGNTPISADEPFEILTGSAFLGDEFHDSLPCQYPLAADEYIRYSNMTAMDHFTLNFQISTSGENADWEQAQKLNPPINDERFHITFDHIFVTPLSTKISLSITPEEGRMTNEDIERIYRYFVYYSYDENGDSMPVKFQKKRVVSSSSEFEEQADGSPVYRVNLDLGPLTVRPAYIEIVPLNKDSSTDDLLWEYAIPVFLPQE